MRVCVCVCISGEWRGARYVLLLYSGENLSHSNDLVLCTYGMVTFAEIATYFCSCGRAKFQNYFIGKILQPKQKFSIEVDFKFRASAVQEYAADCANVTIP